MRWFPCRLASLNNATGAWLLWPSIIKTTSSLSLSSFPLSQQLLFCFGWGKYSRKCRKQVKKSILICPAGFWNTNFCSTGSSPNSSFFGTRFPRKMIIGERACRIVTCNNNSIGTTFYRSDRLDKPWTFTYQNFATAREYLDSTLIHIIDEVRHTVYLWYLDLWVDVPPS